MFHSFHEVKTSQETEMVDVKCDRSEDYEGNIDVVSADNPTHSYMPRAPEHSNVNKNNKVMGIDHQRYDYSGKSNEESFHYKMLDIKPIQTLEIGNKEIFDNNQSDVPNISGSCSSLYPHSKESKCGELPNKNNSLEEYYSHGSEHPVNPTYPEVCITTYESNLTGPVLSHHRCHFCKTMFNTSEDLKLHMKSHQKERPYQCKFCDSTFSQQSNLKIHVRVHTGEKPYQCRECLASFSQISNLKTHLKVHSGEKPYICDVCSMAFSQASNLKSHRLIHSGERPYKCDVCGAAFIQSTHLRSHKRIHTDERPYSCLVCDARFRQMSNLKTHELTHTGVKPHKCNHCEAAFAQKSNLKSHIIKLHSPELSLEPSKRGRRKSLVGFRPHVCDICQATFTVYSNLKIHRRLHTGERPHVCPVCEASFAQKSNLKAHELTHSSDRPFQCVKCSSCFKQKAYLRGHLMKQHYIKQEDLKDFIDNSVLVKQEDTECNESGEDVEKMIAMEYLKECNQEYVMEQPVVIHSGARFVDDSMMAGGSSSTAECDNKEKLKRVEKKYLDSCKFYKPNNNKRYSKPSILHQLTTEKEESNMHGFPNPYNYEIPKY